MTAVEPGRSPDLRPLAATAAAVTILAATGALPLWAGVPHHLALPPLDLFADVRVLLARAPSYPWFVAGLVAVVGLRAVVLAAMLRATDRAGLARALRFYVMVLPVALIAAVFAYSGAMALYSGFLWVAVAVAVLALFALGPRLWAPGATRHGMRLLGYLAALLVVSLPSSLGGAGARLGLVWVSAALTAATVHRLGRSAPGPGGGGDRRARRGRGRGPARASILAAVVAAASVVLTGAPGVPAPATPASGGTLFVVPGNGGSSGTSTMFGLDPAALGFDCDQVAYFSYAGPGGGAPQREARCPIRRGAPYGPADTRRPLAELARFFRAQLDGLMPPVVVITHSQGGWVAAAGITGAARGSPVEMAVLLGAFPNHRRAYRLDAAGPGVVGTDALEFLTAGLRRRGWTTFDPRGALARDLLARPGAVAGLMRRLVAAPGRVVTVTSAFDLPVMDREWRLPGALNLCPVYVHHGSLPRSTVVYDQVRGALAGVRPGGCPWWRTWPTAAFRAFAVPAP